MITRLTPEREVAPLPVRAGLRIAVADHGHLPDKTGYTGGETREGVSKQFRILAA